MDKNEVLAWLQKKGTQATLSGMARYGIQAKRASGVPMGTLLSLSKRLGRDQALSLSLWESGWYEARLLAAHDRAAQSRAPRRGPGPGTATRCKREAPCLNC